MTSKDIGRSVLTSAAVAVIYEGRAGCQGPGAIRWKGKVVPAPRRFGE